MKRIVCINCFRGTLLAVAGIVGFFASAAELHLRSGESAVLAEEGWRTKATVWLDAQNDASFTSLLDTWSNVWNRTESSTGYSLLTADQQIEWRDVRGNGWSAYTDKGGADGVNFNTISAAIAPAFPRRIQQDGKASMTLPANDKARMRLYQNGSASSIHALTGFCVVNASLGGGYALFYDSDKYLTRTSTYEAPYPTKDAPILATSNGSLSMRLDGAAVANPTATGYSDGWQIVSFKCAGASKPCRIGGLGQSSAIDTGNYNGGQIYGEIILFDTLLSEDEIRHVEAYLSKKWGIGIAHATEDHAAEASLFGEGTVTLACDTAATNGVFSGTLDLAGHRLDLPSAAFPFNEATIPSEGRVLWFDPSLDGAVTFGDTPGRLDEIAALAQRDNNGLLTGDGTIYATSPTILDGNAACKRTRLAPGSREGAFGFATNWIEFAEKYSDGSRNCLMLVSNPNPPPTALTSSSIVSVPNVKAGFFALDTTLGAGSQMLTRYNGETGYAKRAEPKASPIISSYSEENVKAATVRLDGIAVDGLTAYFNYRPEVLSVVIPEGQSGSPVKQFGYDGYNSGNREIMGEWLMYDITPDAATCGAIEAYLMNKWLGKLPAGYADFRGATVTGSGTVVVEGPEYLPNLGNGFTGTVEFSRVVWDFTLGKNVGDTAGLVDLTGHGLSLPAEVRVNMNCRAATSGLYPLFKCSSLASGTQFAVGNVAGSARISVVVDGGVVYALCQKPGICVSFR